MHAAADTHDVTGGDAIAMPRGLQIAFPLRLLDGGGGEWRRKEEDAFIRSVYSERELDRER